MRLQALEKRNRVLLDSHDENPLAVADGMRKLRVEQVGLHRVRVAAHIIFELVQQQHDMPARASAGALHQFGQIFALPEKKRPSDALRTASATASFRLVEKNRPCQSLKVATMNALPP